MIRKYFSEKQIYASTFFGGPIPPGILIYKNFKNIGKILTNFEYFNDEYRQAVRIDKIDDICILNIPFEKDYWEDELFLLEFGNLKSTLNIMTNEKFNLRLIHYELTGEITTKDI